LTVFLDSYAIIEMARKNPSYRGYRDAICATGALNLLEAYYVLTEQGYEELGRRCLSDLGPASMPIPLSMIPAIAQFRLSQRGSTGLRFSYADAAGYVCAREHGYSFLTGAHEFRGYPGVEFVR